jgi:hypothetical protein
MSARRSDTESSNRSSANRPEGARGGRRDSAAAETIQAGAVGTGSSWRPTTTWECSECYTINSPGVTFCQQCGRLAPTIEQALLAREEFFVLDGLKALRTGNEEAAHRCFVLATEHAPSSEIAWYWRARTGETIDEVIACLEEITRLNPGDAQARADLDAARSRKETERLVAMSRASAGVDDDSGDGTPGRASDGPRLKLERVRRTLLEVASIPSFGLGVMFAGQAISAALRIVGFEGTASLLPTFALPSILVTVPGDLFRPVAPSFNVLAVVPVLISLWYVRLTFQLADGAPNSRLLALAGGAVALIATPFVVVQQELFLAAGIALSFCAVAGKRTYVSRATPA